MYISVCRACHHFLVAPRPPGTVFPCHECGGALRTATIAERDTFGAGITANTAPKVPVGVSADGVAEGMGVAPPATEAFAGLGPEAGCCPIRPKTVDEVWLACALELLPAAIVRLSREEQQVVIGYYFDQQSVIELAHTHSLDQQGVSSLIQSALAHLRATLR